MARELSTDPYVPTIGTLPPHAGWDEAQAWVERQRARHAEGAGFSFTVVDARSATAVGHCGLWLRDLADGRGTAGYAVVPSARRRGYATDALVALTRFGWTMPGLRRITLLVEPWNVASVRTAERAGYVRDGLLRDHPLTGGARRDVVVLVAEREDRQRGD
ncbi:GNAT family N-acetyltransferase [Cellulomonas sp. JZ18]|nr:GNAT family N-acetyltransferase [Cellulomonas sp. JZ18]